MNSSSELKIQSIPAKMKYSIISIAGWGSINHELFIRSDEIMEHTTIRCCIALADFVEATEDLRDDLQKQITSYLSDTAYNLVQNNFPVSSLIATVEHRRHFVLYIERKDKKPVTKSELDNLDIHFLFINSNFEIKGLIKEQLTKSLESLYRELDSHSHHDIQTIPLTFSIQAQISAVLGLGKCILHFDNDENRSPEEKKFGIEDLQHIPKFIFDSARRDDNYPIKNHETLEQILINGKLGKIYSLSVLFFERWLYRHTPEQKENIETIKKSAITVGKESLSKLSFFSTTPNDINIYIASLTGDRTMQDEETSLKIAEHYYLQACKPV